MNLQDKLEAFQAVVPQWKALIAKAASVTPEQVIVVDIKLLYDREAERAAAKKPAAAAKPAAKAAAAAKPAAAADAAAEPAAAPAASPATKPEASLVVAGTATAPAVNNNRKLKQAADTPAKAEETPAVSDTIAVVEEVPKGPKPNITVFTNIQPLGDMESQSVLGTLGSPYFDKTFREGMKALKLTPTEDYTYKMATAEKEYVFPKEEEPAPPPKPRVNDTDVIALPKGNATVPGASPAPADANATANGTAPAKSSAAGVAAQVAYTLAAAGALALLL